MTQQKGSLLVLSIPGISKGGEEGVPKTFNVNVADVVPVTGKEIEPLERKNLSTLTQGERRFMLKQCWGNAAPEDLPALNSMLSDSHLRAAFEYYQWQYQAQEIRLALPTLVSLIVAEGADTDAGLLALVSLKEQLRQAKVYIIPIHSEESMHWTFITIRKKNQKSTEIESVEYTDWLKGVQSNRDKAEKVWALLTDYKKEPLPLHANGYRQSKGSNDCGVASVWVLERYCRWNRGEGDMCTYPDPKSLRKQLKATLNVLIKEHEEWTLEENLGKKPKVIIQLPGTMITDKKEYAANVKELWFLFVPSNTNISSSNNDRYLGSWVTFMM